MAASSTWQFWMKRAASPCGRPKFRTKTSASSGFRSDSVHSPVKKVNSLVEASPSDRPPTPTSGLLRVDATNDRRARCRIAGVQVDPRPPYIFINLEEGVGETGRSLGPTSRRLGLATRISTERRKLELSVRSSRLPEDANIGRFASS